MNAFKPRMRRHSGSSLLEGLLAIMVFSVGLLAILKLLTVSIAESGNAQYRSEASLLASDLIGQMWTGDRTYQGISDRFGQTASDDYQRWLHDVQTRLPGVTATKNAPSVTIARDRGVIVTLSWQAAADQDAHQLTVHARITD